MIKRYLSFFLSTLLFINCSSDDSPKLSSDNKILSFSLSAHQETFLGNVDNNIREIIIETEGLELLNSIVPDITISEKAFISPDPSVPQNFNTEINYTVTAENGDASIYTIKTQNTPYSDEKKILRFEFNIDNEVFIGNINHEQLFITIETYKDISSLTPVIEISEDATISLNSSESQDFNDYVQYTLTAQNGTTNTYTVEAKRPTLFASITKCYIRAVSGATISGYDLSKDNFQLHLENNNNSYLLDYTDLNVRGNDESPVTDFIFEFDEKIITANDYKLRMKSGNEIIAESDYSFDVLSEGAPKITGVNKTEFVYGETLIITGTDLYPGLRYPYNGNIFVHYMNSRYLTINSEATELKLEWTYSRSQFGSSTPTRVSIYNDGRYAASVAIILK